MKILFQETEKQLENKESTWEQPCKHTEDTRNTNNPVPSQNENTHAKKTLYTNTRFFYASAYSQWR